MAETILTPGKDNSSTEQAPAIDPGYLIKDNLLSEFKTESEKSVARYNLGVPAAENVYTKEEIEPVIVERISKKIAEHLDSSNHITQEEVLELLLDLVRNDGSTPFTAPQAGVDPVSNHDLTTKIYVDRLVQNCLKTADKTKILEQVANTLRDYVKQEDVYTKDEVYTKDQINNQGTKYVKTDGTTPFERPQSGRTPQIGSHLTTKGYVDSLLQSHKQDIDPHGFTEKLNNKLKKYILKESVYDKTQTYSRGQIDSIIDKLVSTAVEEALRSHADLDDPHNILEKVKQLGYILKDGSIAFTAPQKGVDAVNPQDLVTLRQVNKKFLSLEEELSKLEWITSGPTEVTVGNVEINTDLPSTMTVQEIFDAIFYGKGVSISVPEYVNVGDEIPITLCIHGSLALLDFAELYRDGIVIATFNKEDFENGCYTTLLDEIQEDVELTFKAYYTNGAEHEETKLVKMSLPVFIGILPKWKFANTVTYDYLVELSKEDVVNNKFYSEGDNIQKIAHNYLFKDMGLQHPFVVIPVAYPNLIQMSTMSQQFSTEAFDVIDMIPLQVPGTAKDIIYKIYVYRQALSNLDQEVKFKFK